ncbi:MAG: hypothetical protein HYV19_07450 [Gemmatimonadetes bacterium]|nr:hypothetical protein [Gemmatimonadota bacterium]
MPFLPNRLRSIAGLALLCSACSTDFPRAGTDPLVQPPAGVRLIIGTGIVLSGTEINIASNDTLVVRAFVDGNSSAYLPPVITASDPSAISTRSDGSVAVGHPVWGLTLTATAAARSPVTHPATISATGRLTVVCDLAIRFGIAVVVQDSVTGVAPTGSGSTTFRAWSDTYADSATYPALVSGWGGVGERAGVYSVTVDATGYAPWRRDGIEVTRGLCHVHPVQVVARLQRK